MNWTAATHIGGRTYQEDRYVVVEHQRGLLAAVFDGHGGDDASELCRLVLPPLLDNLDRLPLELNPTEMLYTIFMDLDARTSYMSAGTTASMVFLPWDGKAHVAVLGDSPVVISSLLDKAWIAPEHNIRTNQVELEAAIARGGYEDSGYIMKGNTGLQMSRSLGDKAMGAIISKRPDVMTVPIGPSCSILIASDGVTDPRHNDGSWKSTLITMLEKGANADDIVNDARNRRSEDNITAIVIRP